MKPLVRTLACLCFCVAAASTVFGQEAGWTSLFDGKSLDNWTRNGGTADYRVEEGAIVGRTVEGSPNTFLCRGDYKDFVLELEVKCEPRLNSGIQVRSHVHGEDTADASAKKRVRPAGTVYGPQCEIASQATGTAGKFYDEARRAHWLDGEAPHEGEARAAFKDNEWNTYRILVQGDRYRSWINGAPTSDFRDEMDKSGFIGLQVHSIARDQGPYEVRWRNIRIRELEPGEKVPDPAH